VRFSATAPGALGALIGTNKNVLVVYHCLLRDQNYGFIPSFYYLKSLIPTFDALKKLPCAGTNPFTMNKTLGAHLALLSANLIYGASFTIAKIVMEGYIQPFGFVLLRAITAVLLFWTTGFLFFRESTDKKDIPRFAFICLFGIVINQLLFLKGLDLTTPINSAIIMITSPILVLIISVIILKEKITWLKLLGIALGFAGAIQLIKGGFSIGRDTYLGDICIFFNAASWGVYLVLVKPLMKKYHTVTILKWCFLFGIVLVFPFGYEELSQVKWDRFTGEIWFYTLFVIIGTTFVAYLLNIYALNELNPSVVSSYIYLQPFLATMVALFYGKDELNRTQVISAVFIFTGVYLVSRRPKKKSLTENH
jgi:drug/metabolite transporter (DMT)-like permease